MISKQEQQFNDFIKYLKCRDTSKTHEDFGLEDNTLLSMEINPAFKTARDAFMKELSVNSRDIPWYISIEEYGKENLELLKVYYKAYINACTEYPMAFAWGHIETLDMHDLANKMVKAACRCLVKSPIGADTLVVMSTTQKDIDENLYPKTFKLQVRFIDFLSKRLNFYFDKDVLENEIQDALKEKVMDVTEDDLIGRKMHVDDYNNLLRLRDRLDHMMIHQNIKLITGIAGSGKSYQAMVEAKRLGCKDDITMIALSNTVTLKLYKDYKRDDGCESQPRSITSCRLKPVDTANVIIDEFGQWSLNELSLLLDIMKIVDKKGGKLFILGDPEQLNSFLGRGSLLYCLEHYMRHNPSCYQYKNENMRQGEGSTLAQSIKLYTKDKRVGHLASYHTNKIDFDKTLSDDMDDHIFVTGANKTVNDLNLQSLIHLLQYHNLNAEAFVVKKYREEFLNSDSKELTPSIKEGLYRLLCSTVGKLDIHIKLLCRKTSIINPEMYKNAKTFADKLKYKQLTKDKCYIDGVEDGKLRIKFDRSQATRIMGCKEFYENFNFGYAITVNSAQGLDWYDVTVVNTSKDANIRTTAGFYVAITRAKRNLEIFEEGWPRFSDKMPRYSFKDSFKISST